jgi:hypothetical protein
LRFRSGSVDNFPVASIVLQSTACGAQWPIACARRGTPWKLPPC